MLERVRSDKLHRATVCIQRFYRGYRARLELKRRQSALKLVQSSLFAYFAFRRVKYLQMHRAAVVIQVGIV